MKTLLTKNVLAPKIEIHYVVAVKLSVRVFVFALTERDLPFNSLDFCDFLARKIVSTFLRLYNFIVNSVFRFGTIYSQTEKMWTLGFLTHIVFNPFCI